MRKNDSFYNKLKDMLYNLSPDFHYFIHNYVSHDAFFIEFHKDANLLKEFKIWKKEKNKINIGSFDGLVPYCLNPNNNKFKVSFLFDSYNPWKEWFILPEDR